MSKTNDKVKMKILRKSVPIIIRLIITIFERDLLGGVAVGRFGESVDCYGLGYFQDTLSIVILSST
jgi:hypothetical protein